MSKSFVVTPEAPLPGEALPELTNDVTVEQQWVVEACRYVCGPRQVHSHRCSAELCYLLRHADVYYRLLTNVPDPSKLKLTRYD